MLHKRASEGRNTHGHIAALFEQFCFQRSTSISFFLQNLVISVAVREV